MGLRKVADVLAGKSPQPLAMEYLAGLLREHLSADQLRQLGERLAG